MGTASEIVELTREQFETVRATVVAGLGRGRDAWPAVHWLASTNDLMAKKRMLAELDAVLTSSSNEMLTREPAVDNFSSDIGFGRTSAARRRMSRAFDFIAVLQTSMPGATEIAADPEFERQAVARRQTADEHEARTEKLRRLGVRPGEGLPFHELYMKRRSKKNWE